MPTEQLKIDAVLDTKNIKRESKDTAQTMTNDLNKIGNAANDAAQRMEQGFASSFEKINAQAKNTKKLIGDMAAVAMGAQAVNMVGNAIGQTKWGQTDNGKLTSGGLTGAGTGAMSGMALGATIGSVIPGLGTAIGAGIGAAAGALVGAGKGLLDASTELKAAAREQKQNAQSRYESIVKDMDKAQADRNWNRRLQSYADTYGNVGTAEKLAAEADEYAFRVQFESDEQKQLRKRFDAQIAQAKNEEEAKNLYIAAERELTKSIERQQEAQKKLSDLLALHANLQAETARKEEEEKRAIEAKIKAEEAAAKAAQSKAEADARKAAQQSLKDQSSSIKSDMASNKDVQSDLTSELSRITSRGRTLSDSLVKVGGAGGYGQINTAINSNVSKIANTINQLLKTAQSEYQLLQNKLDNLTNGTTWGA